jgi:hypothetical protein
VTGPVLQLTDDTIVVQKGKDKWELARGKDTKVTGPLKAAKEMKSGKDRLPRGKERKEGR